uniref:Ig-like domain-containing protein n=1 Tax=Astatotilapia calliptera TaxID=8154 RepID=A0A3P8QN88_ASTCA
QKSLMISVSLGVSCQQLTASKAEESSLEGSTATLSYRYSRQATGSDQFYWYRQYPGKPPEFLTFNLGTQNTTNSELSVRMVDDRNGLNLQISSAAVSDSAVYYCAVRPTVTGNSKTLEPHTVTPLILTQSLLNNLKSLKQKENLSNSHVAIRQHRIMLTFTGTDMILTFRLLSLYSGKKEKDLRLNIFMIIDMTQKHLLHQLI